MKEFMVTPVEGEMSTRLEDEESVIFFQLTNALTLLVGLSRSMDKAARKRFCKNFTHSLMNR